MPACTATSRRSLVAAVAAVVFLFAAGCASYKLGSPTEPQF
jgi:hypothetical protein